MDSHLNSSEKFRKELREEYFKVVDILQSYDKYYLTIKNWGVTAFGVASAVGISNKAPAIFLLVSLISVGFWLTEVRFKLFQLGHTLRASELEQMLRSSSIEASYPRILSAFGEESRKNIQTERWRSVLFWPQVMLPHVIFVLVGPIIYVVLLFST